MHLPNGVDAARFASGNGKAFRERHGISSMVFVILAMGRIYSQKNQRLAVRLLAELPPHETHLVLIGPVTNPTYAAELRADIEKLGSCQSRDPDSRHPDP